MEISCSYVICRILVLMHEYILSFCPSRAVSPFNVVMGPAIRRKIAISCLQALAQHVAHPFADSTFSKGSSKIAAQLILDFAEVLVFNKLLASQAHYTNIMLTFVPLYHINTTITTHS